MRNEAEIVDRGLHSVFFCFHVRRLYTLCFKKTHPFNFCSNFVSHEPILIIFGRNVAKEICNMQSLVYLLLDRSNGLQLRTSLHVARDVEGHILVKNLI